eukprot:scaffold328_cov130-Cylindrotheca_fusiformis.AAC.10
MDKHPSKKIDRGEKKVKDDDDDEHAAETTHAILAAINDKYSMNDKDDEALEKKSQDAWNLSLQNAIDTYQSSTSITSSMAGSERLGKDQQSEVTPNGLQAVSEVVQAKEEGAAGQKKNHDNIQTPSNRNSSLATTTPPPPDLNRRNNYQTTDPGAIAMGGVGLPPQESEHTIQVGDKENSFPSGILMDAVLVDDSQEQSSSAMLPPAVAAVPMSSSDERPTGVRSILRNRRVACLFALLVIVIVVLAVGLSIMFLSDDSDDGEPIPTSAPTTTTNLLADLLRDSVDDVISWGDTSTPQYKALFWLANDDSWTSRNMADGSFLIPTQIIVERYALVVLYFALNGDFWNRESKMLNANIPSCAWFGSKVCQTDTLHGCEPTGVQCNDQFVTASINAKGVLPAEVGLLSSLRYFWLDKNSLFGPVPSEFFQLSSLESLSLLNNDLTGSIPREIALAPNLQILDLARNNITGTLNSVVNPSLKSLALEENSLEGTIPLDIGSMTLLDFLDLGDNLLSGTLPSSIGDMDRLYYLGLYDNADLTGNVPASFSDLNLFNLYIDGTDLTNVEDVFCDGLFDFDEFYADCGGTIPKVQCYCCTHCCNANGNCRNNN